MLWVVNEAAFAARECDPSSVYDPRDPKSYSKNSLEDLYGFACKGSMSSSSIPTSSGDKTTFDQRVAT